MKSYYYRGIDKNNEKINGNIQAKNKEQAINMLKCRKISITYISFFNLKRNQSLKDRQISFFANQLYYTLSSGIDIDRALGILEKGSKGVLKDKICKTRGNLEYGLSFSQALVASNFPQLFVSLISLGEKTGRLEDVLKRLGKYYDNKSGIKEKIKNSLLYPFVIMFFLCISVVFAVFFIIPNYLEIFKSFDADLPKVTLLLMGITGFFQDYYVYIFFMAIVLILSMIFVSKKNRYFLHSILLKIPIVKEFIILDFNYFFVDTLGLMLMSGMTFTNSMEEVILLLKNERISSILRTFKENIEDGMDIEYTFSNKVFLDMTKTGITIGMESGRLEESLSNTADIYRMDLNLYVKKMEKFIEIFVTIIIGLVLGFVMIALILPSFYIVNLI